MTSVTLADAVALRTLGGSETPDLMRKHYYGDVVLCAPFRPVLADYDRKQPTPYGLHPLHQAFYAVVRGASGKTYNAQRFNHGTMVPRLHLTATDGGPAWDCTEAKGSFYGYTSNEIEDGQWVIASRGKAERAMHFAVTPGQGATWTESNILSLELTQVGPAVEMYHPDCEHDSYYNGHVCSVRGEILGDPVEGLAGFELGWARGALEWRELPMPSRIEEQWMLYVTRFADSTEEIGHLYTTADGRGTGLRWSSDGGPEVLAGVRGEFDFDKEKRIPTHVRWHHAGRTWECITDSPSTTSPRNPSYMWQLGRTRRLGDDREILSSWTFAETLPRVLPQA